MASLGSAFSFPPRNHRFPSLNSTSQRRNLLSSKRSYPSYVPHKPHHSAFPYNLQNPRSWSPNPRSDFSCLRCGGYEHLARLCRNPIKCFSCGDLGHKSFYCFKNRSSIPTPNCRNSGSVFEEVSCILQASQFLDSGERVDPLLLDPDVGDCTSSFNIGLENSISELKATGSEIPMDEVASLEVLPVMISQEFVGTFPNSGLINPIREASGFKGVDAVMGLEGFDIRPDVISHSYQMEEWMATNFSVSLPRSLSVKVSLEAFLVRLAGASIAARGSQGFSSPLCNLSAIRIIDKAWADISCDLLEESQGAITFFIKPCKFFLYCFLAAFRNQVTLLPLLEVGKRSCSLFTRPSFIAVLTTPMSISVFLVVKGSSAGNLLLSIARKCCFSPMVLDEAQDYREDLDLVFLRSFA